MAPCYETCMDKEVVSHSFTILINAPETLDIFIQLSNAHAKYLRELKEIRTAHRKNAIFLA